MRLVNLPLLNTSKAISLLASHAALPAPGAALSEQSTPHTVNRSEAFLYLDSLLYQESGENVGSGPRSAIMSRCDQDKPLTFSED